MTATPIPDEEFAALQAVEDTRFMLGRVVMSSPSGDLTGETDGIMPVEAGVGPHPALKAVTYTMRIVLEEGDLERLIEGAPIWLTMAGGVSPFFLTT